MSSEETRAIVARTAPGSFTTDVRVRSHVFVMDEPEDVGGSDEGPTPGEMVAAALAACTTITMRMYADRKGWPLGAVEVRVERLPDEPAEGGRKPTPRYRRTLAIDGDLDEAQMARMRQVADRCPVHRQLEHGSEIVTELAD